MLSINLAWVVSLSLVASPGVTGVEETIRTQCVLYAAEVTNPWAMAHGITALGPQFAASDGRLATEAIMKDFLQKGTDTRANPYSFARYGADGTPIEPHTNLIVKTFVLAGVPLKKTFATSFGPVTLKKMVEGIQRGFAHVPGNEDYWRDVAWTLDLLGATLKPGAVFENGLGHRIEFNTVMDDALRYLEKAQADIAEGMVKGLPQVDKRKQGIYSHSCGGFHLVQAVNAWARHPSVRKRWGRRLEKQTAVLFYRLESETRQYDAALRQAPQYRLQILTQQMKFYGHFLETTGRMKKEMHFVPTPAQKQAIAKAKVLLQQSVTQLLAISAFDSMESMKQNQKQIYLDLIGDACHAAHGLKLWR